MYKLIFRKLKIDKLNPGVHKKHQDLCTLKNVGAFDLPPKKFFTVHKPKKLS